MRAHSHGRVPRGDGWCVKQRERAMQLDSLALGHDLVKQLAARDELQHDEDLQTHAQRTTRANDENV